MVRGMQELSLGFSHLADQQHNATPLGETLLEYFAYRADILNNSAQHLLMNAAKAKALFQKLRRSHIGSCHIPMNKQKGDKRAESYFTGIINMLVEANLEGLPCNYNPDKLTAVTYNDAPLRTLSRRVDGAFPFTVNPIAIWEVKEYYYTTTFGSRVADGVYETLLDGLELEELREHEGIDVKHYLMIDDHNTWWNMGRSYLCRMIDMLHMGYVDEVLFGTEVVDRLPVIVKEWVSIARERGL